MIFKSLKKLFKRVITKSVFALGIRTHSSLGWLIWVFNTVHSEVVQPCNSKLILFLVHFILLPPSKEDSIQEATDMLVPLSYCLRQIFCQIRSCKYKMSNNQVWISMFNQALLCEHRIHFFDSFMEHFLFQCLLI